MKTLIKLWLYTFLLSGGLPLLEAKPTNSGTDGNTEKTRQWVADGDAYQASGQLSAAIENYRQASRAGNVAGTFAAGDCLLRLGESSQGRERVLHISEGLHFLFRAATNAHANACAKISEAMINGIGVETNRVAAYAWLAMAAKFDNAYKPDLDQLATHLEPEEVLHGQESAAAFAKGIWPNPSIYEIKSSDPRVQFQGICLGRTPLVTLNGKPFTTGESMQVYPANAAKGSNASRLNIKCVEINANYALINIAGEPGRILLATSSH